MDFATLVNDSKEIGGALLALYMMHRQSLKKLDKIADNQGQTNEILAVHNEKFKAGSKQFDEIAEHQKEQDSNIRDLTLKTSRICSRVNVLEKIIEKE